MSNNRERSYLSPRMAEMQRRIDAGSENKTKAASKAYAEGWDRIFSKKTNNKKASENGKE